MKRIVFFCMVVVLLLVLVLFGHRKRSAQPPSHLATPTPASTPLTVNYQIPDSPFRISITPSLTGEGKAIGRLAHIGKFNAEGEPIADVHLWLERQDENSSEFLEYVYYPYRFHVFFGRVVEGENQGKIGAFTTLVNPKQIDQLGKFREVRSAKLQDVISELFNRGYRDLAGKLKRGEQLTKEEVEPFFADDKDKLQYWHEVAYAWGVYPPVWQ